MLGRVEGIAGQRVRVRLAGPVRRGDGVVFEGDRSADDQQGGRVYEIFQGGRPVEEASAGTVELAFARDAIDLRKIRPGQTLWKTDDPRLERRLRKTFAGRRSGACRWTSWSRRSWGAAANRGRRRHRRQCCVESPEPLVEAVKHALTAEMLDQQLGRLGHTVYRLRHLNAPD